MHLIFLVFILVQAYTINSKSKENNDNKEDCPVLDSSVQVPEIKYFLPKDYKTSEIPYENGPPLDVSINLLINQIGKIDPVTMTFSMTILMGLHYRDYRICSSFAPNSTVILHNEWNQFLWKPNIYFENAIDRKSLLPQPTLALQPGKIIMIYDKYSMVLSCDMKLSFYPHDTQMCYISIATVAAFDNEIRLKWHGLKTAPELVLPEFDIIHVENLSSPMIGLIGNYSRLIAEIHLKRCIGYFVLHIYIPSILIVVMSMLSFWMPPEATPARCALPVTSLLTLATAQGQISITSISYVMAIDVWMLGCVAFVFATLVEYAIVNYALRWERMRKQQAASVQPLFLKISQEKKEDETKKMTGTKEDNQRSYMSPAQIDRISCIIFPFLFIVQIAFYFSYYA